MSPKREGPFKITKVLGPLSYRLKLPIRWKIHDVFHASLLSPYSETETHGPNFTYPPPDLIDGEEEHEVEAIRAHRKRGKGYSYLIKWKNLPTGEESWEPRSNITHADETLEAYQRLHNLPPFDKQKKDKRTTNRRK